ncbi:hypothetical protein V6N13_033161 [Hibiscus sabdariffa]
MAADYSCRRNHTNMGKVSQKATVFVHNLPEKMHWKGLWATFAHHGDVIPMKRSRKVARHIGERLPKTRLGVDNLKNQDSSQRLRTQPGMRTIALTVIQPDKLKTYYEKRR